MHKTLWGIGAKLGNTFNIKWVTPNTEISLLETMCTLILYSNDIRLVKELIKGCC